MKSDESPTDTNNHSHVTSINGDIHREPDPDTQCGIGAFRPAFLQVFARIGAFIGIYCASGLLTSTLTVYINSQVNMLEKQFGFSSTETGLLMSCNDIGFLSCIIFCGFIARKVHIPRGLGISTILFGVCGIMCALPYFLQDRSTYEIEDQVVSGMSNNMTNLRTKGLKVPICGNQTIIGEDGCDLTVGSAQASANIQQLHIKKVAYCLIAFGMVFQGVGKSVRYPFTTLYVDDAVDKRKTGFYMGIVIGTAIFGPALAFLIGGLFSKIYVTLEPVDITPSDPRWIGAWWLGFLVFGACAILFSVPIMCFPRKLKSKSRMKDLEMSEKKVKPAEKKTTVAKILKHEFKDFGQTICRLLRNPVYMVIAVSSVVNLIGVSGSLSFSPKYIATQYTVPLWQANIILALSGIIAVALGTFLGGILSRKIEMTPQTTFKMLIIFELIHIVCMCSGFLLGCDQPALVGDNGKGELSSLYRTVEQSCIQGCTCDDDKYFPVCGDDGRSYFSPCHAGCTEKSIKNFMNCTCIPSGNAVAGLCDQGCSTNMYIYRVLAFIGGLFSAFKIIPTVLAKIRCVDERDRGSASAFSGFLNSALGWMPGPVIFGAVVDGTCTLWKYTCGERQSCLLYDIVFFRKAIHTYAAAASVLSTLIITVMYIYLRVKGITQWRHKEEIKQPDKSVIVENEIKDDNI